MRISESPEHFRKNAINTGHWDVYDTMGAYRLHETAIATNRCPDELGAALIGAVYCGKDIQITLWFKKGEESECFKGVIENEKKLFASSSKLTFNEKCAQVLLLFKTYIDTQTSLKGAFPTHYAICNI